jgi:hypothetical protein
MEDPIKILINRGRLSKATHRMTEDASDRLRWIN